jgi:hypothetical protein
VHRHLCCRAMNTTIQKKRLQFMKKWLLKL